MLTGSFQKMSLFMTLRKQAEAGNCFIDEQNAADISSGLGMGIHLECVPWSYPDKR